MRHMASTLGGGCLVAAATVEPGFAVGVAAAIVVHFVAAYNGWD